MEALEKNIPHTMAAKSLQTEDSSVLQEKGSDTPKLATGSEESSRQSTSGQDRITWRGHVPIKREKSHTDSIEREKKRVKFSPTPMEYRGGVKERRGRDVALGTSRKRARKGILKNSTQGEPPSKKGIFQLSMDSYFIGSVDNASPSVASNPDDIIQQTTFTKNPPSTHIVLPNPDLCQTSIKDSSTTPVTHTADGGDVLGRQKIVSKASKLRQGVMPSKQSRGQVGIKRNLNDKENVAKVSSESPAREPCRKCLKTAIEEVPNHSLKPALTENSLRRALIHGSSTPCSRSQHRERRKVQEEESILEKQIRDLQNNDESKLRGSPRAKLTRSVSAASAISKKRPLLTKQIRSIKKNDPAPFVAPCRKPHRDEGVPKGSNGVERRFVSKLEQMRRHIEAQQRQIIELNERLQASNPNLKSLSKLSASVPTVYEGDTKNHISRLTSKQPSYADLVTLRDESLAISSQPLFDPQLEIRQKDKLGPAMMASYEEVRCKSLDVFVNKLASTDQPASLRYSSLVSLNGKRREVDLAEENEMLKAELQETRDHAELLEFRILEFTEGIQGATNVVLSTCDQSTNTQVDDVTTSHPIGEDLSLPLSVDSGLELNVDLNKSRFSTYRKALARLEEIVGPSESNSVSQLSALIDWVFSIYGGPQYDNLPISMSPRSLPHKKVGLTSSTEDHCFEENLSGADLAMLATKLQETLTDPKAQEEVLEETIVKLRLVSASLSRLQSRVNSLSAENRDLQETITALHDSHETRTEASGTESELVHGKSPSIHSDLSDSESDDASRPAKQTLETATSFQESGIFETSCELVNSSTQTFQDSEFGEESLLEGEPSNSTTSEMTPDAETNSEKLEVDLQTALARLTSIKNVVQGKELRQLRLQDLQEKDEYLVAALEGEKVTLCKIEYDTIVATERSLQREIEMLQYEKEQLAVQCATLEGKLAKANNDDTSEVLKAQLRLLEERWEVSERQRRQYFDDKCEIEEAENDARLLAQRLESQLEAAREMESLLSASLSQEQEFCRELQRRVREMQEIDKGRRLHEEVLEKESQFCRRREAALIVANDTQKSQLTFALYGLILAQFWRKLATANKKALVPFTSLRENAFLVNVSEVGKKTSFPLFPSFPCNNECQQCLHQNFQSAKCINVYDASTQTSADDVVLEEVKEVVMIERLKPLERVARAMEEELSDREKYYLSQIEALQKERKMLREDYENEQSTLTRRLETIKSEVERLQKTLEESQHDKCKLQLELEEAHDLVTESNVLLENQAKELKMEFKKSVEVYQQEQKAMQDQYEDRISEMRRNIEFHEHKFSALLQQYSILQHELEPYFQNGSDCTDGYSSEEGVGAKILTTKDLLSAVRELVRSESSVKQKLHELEKKESAYRETINEADRIMSNHVTIYTRRIEDLEAALEQKCSRIQQLEKSEERLRTTMKNSWKSSEGTRITELLDRLIETENSELNLKERVWNLERNGKELQIKFAETEKVQENLRSELRDQEELVQRLMTLTSENNALTTQLQEAHEAARRASDIQQSENYLKSRVDELEAIECNLRDSLKQAEQILKQRDRKFRDQVAMMEEEIASLRSQMEQRTEESRQAREAETCLRQQVENFKGQVQNLEKELKESSSESICHETQHRSEVTKLRSHLKLVNSQLTDLDTLNGELKERLTAAEAAMKEVALQLEEKSRRHEKDLVSFNLQLSQKDAKMEEFEAQLQQISHSNVVGELDFLASSPLVTLQHSLIQFIKTSEQCVECRRTQSSNVQILNDCLKTLNELVNGRNSQSDSEVEDSESPSADNLANEPPSTTSYNLAQEGLSDPSSGEADALSLCSSTTTKERDPTAPLPSVPPRPRRDAKKKKRVRKTPKNEGSLLNELEESTVENGSFYGNCIPSTVILEELEEKVRELEDAVARKDEELRLADGEAAELHQRLMEEDGKLSQKTDEANLSSEAVISLRQQLLLTVQEYENVRVALEDKHKVDVIKLTKKIEVLTDDLLRLSKKANLKDRIIDTLVNQIRSILRSGSTSILVNQIKKISEDTSENGMSIANNDDEGKIRDFDVESVCNVLEEQYEVSAAPETTKVDSLSCHSLPSLPSPADSGKIVKKSRSSSETRSTNGLMGVSNKKSPESRSSLKGNLPPLDLQCKSRIPRLRPSSGPPLKHDDCPLREFTPKPFKKQSKVASPASGEVVNRPSEPIADLKPLAKVVPKQRPMAKVTPKFKKSLEDPENKNLTDARKIKRIVTGLTSVNASVDCSSAPDYGSQQAPPTPSCVPRPKDLRITRRVGIDGVVIAWSPLDHDCVAGFQVVVGGSVVQLVRSPHRTKALVTGLPFPSPFTIGLVAVAEDGRCSTPTLVSYETSGIYKPKLQQRTPPLARLPLNATPRRSSVPTCL